MAFASKFGSTPQRPSVASYLAIALAASTALVWPLETAEGNPYVASELDVAASAANLSLAMPPADQGGNGIASIITGTGAQAFTLTDASGNAIVVVNPGVSWIVSLIDNSTTAGTWRAYQLGATVSNAQAGQLADNETIQAAGTTLRVFFPTNYLTQNTLLQAQNRGSVNVWQGSQAQQNGVFQLDTAAHLASGWFAFVANESTGTLTIQPSNSETLNGAANLVLTPGNTALIACTIQSGIGSFNALGLTPSPLPIAGGGTGAGTAGQALINLGATTTGLAIFTSASPAAVLALLGLSTISFVETTVSTNQTLNLSSSQSCFACTAPLTLTLPLTATLTTKYVFCVYAQGGNVTVTPQAADKINNAAAGASFTVQAGTSGMFTTDANGNWWPFFTSTGGTVSSVGLSAPAEFVVTGSPVTGTGTLTFSKAAQNANTVYAGPSSGGAATPAFRLLTTADGATGPGSILFSAAIQTPAGYLLCDGSAVSRTTFANLFNAITIQTIGTTINGSPIITAMGTTALMEVGYPISGVGIPAGATVLSIDGPTQIHIGLNGVPLNATASNAGTPLVVAPFGVGDGALSFNVPDQRGRAAYGADKMQGGAAAGRLGGNASAGGFATTAVLGSAGGSQTHTQIGAEVGPHAHGAGGLTATRYVGQQGTGLGNGPEPTGAFQSAAAQQADSNGLPLWDHTESLVSGSTAVSAAANPMNITGPGLSYNVYIKV